jgi:hypothetical protein
MSEGGKQLMLARNLWEIMELLELIKGGTVVMQTNISKMSGTGVKSSNVLSLAKTQDVRHSIMFGMKGMKKLI